MKNKYPLFSGLLVLIGGTIWSITYFFKLSPMFLYEYAKVGLPYNKHFKNSEFADKQSGKGGVHFVVKMICELIRERLGVPIVITSGYDDPDTLYKDRILSSAHVKGLAVDFQQKDGWEFEKYELALKILDSIGVNRVGHYIKDNRLQHIHFDLDVLKSQVKWYKINGEYVNVKEFERKYDNIKFA